MTSLQVELLEPLSLSPGVLCWHWCFGAWSVVLLVGLLDVRRCLLLGQVPRKVDPWVDGSLRYWPSGSSADTSSWVGYSCSEKGTCRTRYVREQGLVPLHSRQNYGNIRKGVVKNSVTKQFQSPKTNWGFQGQFWESS